MIERDRLLGMVVPAVLVGVAGVLMFFRLDEPARIIFDEVYYVGDARQYLEHAVERDFAVHPPVGKWLIATSIALLGDQPAGWRAAGALVGALSVLLTYLTGLRLFRRVGPAAVAGLLLATDGLWLVQARTAMLDIFLGFFTVLGAWLLLVDRDRAGLAKPPPAPSGDGPALPRRGHPYRMLAGVAFGLAVATKWSGLLPLAAAGLLTLGWEMAWRRRWTGRALAGWRRGAGSLLVALVLVPAAVYVGSYVPWLVNYGYSHEGGKECAEGEVVADPCPIGPIGRLQGLGRSHAAIWRFHTTLEAQHPYRAPAYTWPVMARPVVYYYESCSADRAAGSATTGDDGESEPAEPCLVEPGEAAEILAVGNPALWWTFLAATALLAAGLVRRDARAWFVTGFWAWQFLPWLLVARPSFFFYMVPVVPFLALGVAYAVAVLDERRALAGTLVGASLGAGAGLLAGIGVEAATSAETTTLRWLLLVVGWMLGAAAGTRLDRDRPVDAADAGWPVGTTVGVVVTVVAVALLAYFLPVWTGETLPAEVVRQRWWFDGWI